MGSPLPISIVATELRLTDLRTRLPFRFGGAILNTAPLATLRVLVKTEDGEDAEWEIEVEVTDVMLVGTSDL